jgi:predicted deacylase
LEVGGGARQEPRYVQAILQVLENAQRHLGMKAGKPRPIAGDPLRLDHAVLLRSACAGIYQPRVAVGQWLEQGSRVAQVVDFDGALLEEIRTPEAGVVMCLPLPRGIKANSFAAKIGVV